MALTMILSLAACGSSGTYKAEAKAKTAAKTPAESPQAPSVNTATSTGHPSESIYAGIVRDYESKYGKLTFTEVNYSTYYTGVFLVKLLDLNQDGVDELLIGYSTEVEEIQDYITAPKLDVWTIVNTYLVKAYEGAIVHHGDIGSHCAYINMDGQYYLITGSDGYESDLHLMVLHNGEFQDFYTLYNDREGTCLINNRQVNESEWAELYQKIDKDAIEYLGIITDFGQETEESLREALEEGYMSVGL